MLKKKKKIAPNYFSSYSKMKSSFSVQKIHYKTPFSWETLSIGIIIRRSMCGTLRNMPEQFGMWVNCGKNVGKCAGTGTEHVRNRYGTSVYGCVEFVPVFRRIFREFPKYPSVIHVPAVPVLLRYVPLCSVTGTNMFRNFPGSGNIKTFWYCRNSEHFCYVICSACSALFRNVPLCSVLLPGTSPQHT